MKKVIIVLISGMIFSGCGRFERTVANYTGWSSQCINGVEYIQFASGASVSYTPEGKVKTCN